LTWWLGSKCGRRLWRPISCRRWHRWLVRSCADRRLWSAEVTTMPATRSIRRTRSRRHILRPVQTSERRFLRSRGAHVLIVQPSMFRPRWCEIGGLIATRLRLTRGLCCWCSTIWPCVWSLREARWCSLMPAVPVTATFSLRLRRLTTSCVCGTILTANQCHPSWIDERISSR